VPESGQDFETMMREIDSELAREGIPIDRYEQLWLSARDSEYRSRSLPRLE
jgi:hypothetical protein